MSYRDLWRKFKIPLLVILSVGVIAEFIFIEDALPLLVPLLLVLAVIISLEYIGNAKFKNPYIGRLATTLDKLCPVGRVNIGSDIVIAKTEDGNWIQENVNCKVVDFRDELYIVELYSESEDNESTQELS